MRILRTASLGSSFTGSYIKKNVCRPVSSSFSLLCVFGDYGCLNKTENRLGLKKELCF